MVCPQKNLHTNPPLLRIREFGIVQPPAEVQTNFDFSLFVGKTARDGTKQMVCRKGNFPLLFRDPVLPAVAPLAARFGLIAQFEFPVPFQIQRDEAEILQCVFPADRELFAKLIPGIGAGNIFERGIFRNVARRKKGKKAQLARMLKASLPNDVAAHLF